MDKKSMPLSIKNIDQSGVFSGYASIFNKIDSHKDIIVDGAFSETNEKVKLLWQHDPKEPIGMIDSISQDATGLFVKARLLFAVQRAKEAYALLKEGIINGLSIGYTPLKFKRTKNNRILYKVMLWEISLVTFPSNSDAVITEVKNDDTQAIIAAINNAIFKLNNND